MEAPVLWILIRLDTVYLSAVLQAFGSACKINRKILVGGKKAETRYKKKGKEETTANHMFYICAHCIQKASSVTSSKVPMPSKG